MSKINQNAIDYVNNLFNKINTSSLVPNSGTIIGNIKSELLKRNGIDFIKKYDLQIEQLAHTKIYR